MITVKLNSTLRVKIEDGTYRNFQKGAVFTGQKTSDLPDWLQDEMKYFKESATCDTLVISEIEVKGKRKASQKASEDKTKSEKKEVVKPKEKPAKTKPKTTLTKRKK